MKLTRFFSAVGIMLATASTLSCSGDDGDDGADGTGCSLTDKGVEYVVKCGDEKAEWAKAWCGREAYDPKKNICYNDILGVEIGEQIWMTNDYVTKESTDGKYTWTVASTICPIGWALPSKAEFEELLGGLDRITVADLVAKGFSAEAGKEWWSEERGSDAYYLRINAGGEITGINIGNKTELRSIRCIRK